MSEQNFANHRKFVPAFHFFVLPVVLLNLVWSVYQWKGAGFRAGAFMSVLLAVALFVGFVCARLFALTVQDRVIRLEERMRLNCLLPDDLRGRVAEFTPRQLVAMRFASDAEVPALARRVLDEKLADLGSIKRLVQNWRADHLRA